MPKLRPEPRDPANPDYGEFQTRGSNSLILKCEECGTGDMFTADREPFDERDKVYIQMGLNIAARTDGWKIHVQAILCPKCHLEHMIGRDFEPEQIIDEDGYEAIT